MSDTPSSSPVRAAMVLAAGLGKRMRPVTDTMPKPLVEVGGKALIDHALDRLMEAGVRRAVVNVHYLAEQVEAHVARRREPEIVVSDERGLLLETGGGVLKALPHLVDGAAGDTPFFVLNSDSLWIEGARPNLTRMIEAWDPARMDALVLLAPTATSIGYDGAGDFRMDNTGLIARRAERQVTPFVYAGTGLFKPSLFTNLPEGAFSLNLVFDRLLEVGRLHGLRLDGAWLHVGTPEAIHAADEALAASVL
jgi:MurNAc alpha-1-phosphate uridylyltransferase